ncbi:MAG: PVC-type heme-binding CxxCH protein, partial [Planctomycetota bacterium]
MISHTRWVACAGLVAATCWLLCAGGSPAGEIELATDAPKPSPPEESLKHFRLPEGFRMELVASEPHVADPVSVAFDAQGRIIVCEIHGYNLEGYLDVRELNKQGVLDTAVRRIAANPEAIKRAEQDQYGSVKLLEDSDGDGRVDRSTVLADRLPPCYGAVPARGGVIVLCAPQIVYLADRDGDGKAEIRRTLFSGFGIGELWTRINNPRWGLDNWIYGVSGGGSGGTIRGQALPADVSISAVCFRFKSDGSAFQPASGSTYGFGQAIDDWGDRFLCTNQQHALYVAPLPYRYLARNPFYAAPDPVVNICTYGHPARVYPTSRPHPWRWARSQDPAWVKFYGAAEATANGYFTAASGQTLYQADQFPPEYRGNHFSVDNAQNMVHRCLLLPEGTGYQVRRPRDDEQEEFLTSTEPWFRPVNLATGPDGSLYVVDMYREIIEDYSAIPRYLQQLYIRSLIAGAERGRIWRVVAEGAPRPRKFDLAKAPTARLVGELANGNVWWRRTAQRLLVERGDPAAVPPLAALVREGKTPQARLHALYSLEGLDALEPDRVLGGIVLGDIVERALGDRHFAVRMHALRLAEHWLDDRPTLTEKVLGMIDDEHPRVRLQLALTLGQSSDRRAARAIAALAARGGADRWMQAAVLSSAADSADRMLGEIVRQG